MVLCLISARTCTQSVRLRSRAASLTPHVTSPYYYGNTYIHYEHVHCDKMANRTPILAKMHCTHPRLNQCHNIRPLRGVAARAGNVHLIFSIDWKPSRKGGARPRPKKHHPVPQGPSFSIKCRLATGCPPEAHNQSQLKHAASSRPKHTQTLGGHSATPPTQELTSFPVWAG